MASLRIGVKHKVERKGRKHLPTSGTVQAEKKLKYPREYALCDEHRTDLYKDTWERPVSSSERLSTEMTIGHHHYGNFSRKTFQYTLNKHSNNNDHITIIYVLNVGNKT